MNNRAAFLRAVSGPILLIALGVLFVLDQSGEVRFIRTWPILLILFGAFRLAERMVAPPVTAAWNGGAGLGPGAGSHPGSGPVAGGGVTPGGGLAQ